MICLLTIAACSGTNPVANPGPQLSREGESVWQGPQVLLGVNKDNFYEKYPDGNLLAMLWACLDFGVSFYGDDLYAAKWTGGGLSFAAADAIVPAMLSHPNAKHMYFWFPVSTHNLEKLAATYNHWKAKGWLDAAKWFVFMAPVADEPRTVDEVKYNNISYLQFKVMFPEIKWMVTREATFVNDDSLKVLADIYMPMLHWWEIENCYHDYYGTHVMDDYHTATARGGYISGWLNQPWSFEPDYYDNMCATYGVSPPPYVPTFGNGGTSQIPGYCRENGMEIFLFWNLLDLLQPGPGGIPVPNSTALQFLSGYD